VRASTRQGASPRKRGRAPEEREDDRPGSPPGGRLEDSVHDRRRLRKRTVSPSSSVMGLQKQASATFETPCLSVAPELLDGISQRVSCPFRGQVFRRDSPFTERGGGFEIMTAKTPLLALSEGHRAEAWRFLMFPCCARTRVSTSGVLIQFSSVAPRSPLSLDHGPPGSLARPQRSFVHPPLYAAPRTPFSCFPLSGLAAPPDTRDAFPRLYVATAPP